MHPVERDIRKWSHEFLEKPSDKLNGLPPCPYAKQAWLDDKITFSINTGLDGLTEEIKKFFIAGIFQNHIGTDKKFPLGTIVSKTKIKQYYDEINA